MEFNEIWPQIDEYNIKCREAEKYLLNMVQQLSQRTPESYTEVLHSLANAVHATILKGGVVAACTMDDMKYIAIVNYKPKEVNE